MTRPRTVHFGRLTHFTPCGRLRTVTLASTERSDVTCRRCLAFLQRWPGAV